MDYVSGLGDFQRLPAEVRIQVWEEFLPSKRKGRCSADGPGTDLRILRASKILYDELSYVLYSKAHLRLELTPIFSEKARLRNKLWCTVHFKSRYQAAGASWRIREKCTDRDSPIWRFPFHLIASVEVSLLAPRPVNPRQAFWLWVKVQSTVEMFRESSHLPPLTIRLDKFNGQDWDGTDGISDVATNTSTEKKGFHNLYVLPFYCLPAVQSVQVETHSEELRKKLDWSLLDQAAESFFKKTQAEQLKFYQNVGSELDRKLHRNLLLQTQPTLLVNDRRRLRDL